jgi:hypothetical protein
MSDIDRILERRDFKDTNIEALNAKILNTSFSQKQNNEFSVLQINTKFQAIAITACFVVGIFSGMSFNQDSINTDIIDYIYAEEGIL